MVKTVAETVPSVPPVRRKVMLAVPPASLTVKSVAVKLRLPLPVSLSKISSTAFDWLMVAPPVTLNRRRFTVSSGSAKMSLEIETVKDLFVSPEKNVSLLEAVV